MVPLKVALEQLMMKTGHQTGVSALLVYQLIKMVQLLVLGQQLLMLQVFIRVI
jgi:hypothetical protein